MARMLAPINTIKHYVQKSNTAVASGTRIAIPIVSAVVAPATASTDQVKEGSIIKTCFIEIWIKGTGASDATTQFNIALEKVPGAAANAMGYADMLNMGAYDNKKNILFSGQGVIGGVGGGQSIPVMRNWYKLPKGKQRFGLGDDLVVSVATTGQAMQVCGLATYKEYI